MNNDELTPNQQRLLGLANGTNKFTVSRAAMDIIGRLDSELAHLQGVRETNALLRQQLIDLKEWCGYSSLMTMDRINTALSYVDYNGDAVDNAADKVQTGTPSQ